MSLRLYSLAFFLIINVPLFAQDGDNDEAINYGRIGRPAIKMAITNIINFSDALLPVGVEYRFHKWFGVSGEVGIPLFFNTLAYNTSGSEKKLHSDFRLRTELRAYFNPNADGDLAFIGIDGAWRRQGYQLLNGTFVGVGFDEYGDQKQFSYTSMDVKKSVYTAHVIAGMQSNLSTRLFVELHTGLGIKHVRMEKTNINGLSDAESLSKFAWLFPVGRTEDRMGDNTRFISIPLAVKFCYRL